MELLANIDDKRVSDICNEYYKRVADYGIVHASMWLRINLEDEDVKAFKQIQTQTARKYGFT